MSILDKPLAPQPRRSKRRPAIIILSILAVLFILLLVLTDIRADIAFVVHFVSVPNHFTYYGHSDYISAVAWSPDGTRIASASNDGTVQVWRAFTGNTILTHKSSAEAKGSPVPWNAVAWSPNGKDIVIGGIGNIEVRDAATDRFIASYGYHAAIVHALAWSPDGRYIAVGSSASLVELWDTLTGRNVYSYQGHNADVLSIAWSPDGKRIVSGSSDGTAQVWDALTGNNAYTYRGHADYYWGHLTSGASVNTVAWSPDGSHIASGSSDKTVQVWQAL